MAEHTRLADLPSKFSSPSAKRLSLLALGLFASLVYVAALNFGLFNDDPTGTFAWLDSHSLPSLFVSPFGSGFYRPVGFALWKVMSIVLGGNNSVALHAVSILLHGANTVAVWLLAHRLLKRPGAAWAAAIIFACGPFSYEAVAYVAALFYPLVTLWVIVGLLSYDRGRETGRLVYWLITLICVLGALFSHENGLALVVLLWIWEVLFLGKAGRRRALALLVTATLLAGLFLLIWVSLQHGIAGRGHPLAETLANVLPFLQEIASPFLSYLRLSVDQPLQLAGLAGLALILAGVAASAARLLRTYLFTLLWIVVTAAPAVLFLTQDYVTGGVRLFYFTWAGISLLWGLPFAAIAQLLSRRRLAVLLQLVLLALAVIPPVRFVRCELALYGDATRLVRGVAAISRDHAGSADPVFVNLPIFFKESPSAPQGCSNAYPWLNNGAIVFPAYANLQDFNRYNGAGDRPARGAAIAAFDAVWPPRYGVRIEISDLRALLREQPVHIFDTKTWSFFPLSETWRVADPPAGSLKVILGDEIGLEDARVDLAGHVVTATLRWRLLAAPRPLTAFVHVYDASGKLVAQHDAPLGQAGARLLYAPFEFRQQGDLIEDRVYLELPMGLAPGEYTVAAGVYDPTTVVRLAARTAAGEGVPDNLYILGRVALEPVR